ncbi:unnamed protein product, partial [Dovyalis caffra]
NKEEEEILLAEVEKLRTAGATVLPPGVLRQPQSEKVIGSVVASQTLSFWLEGLGNKEALSFLDNFVGWRPGLRLSKEEEDPFHRFSRAHEHQPLKP